MSEKDLPNTNPCTPETIGQKQPGPVPQQNQKQTQPTSIENQCPDSVPVRSCAGSPLEVTVTNPSPIVDVDYVCDASTNTWHKIQTITPLNTDGTLGTQIETNTDTGISCDLPKPDFEPVRICDATTQTIHLVDYSYDEDGVKTEIGRVDTGEACGVGDEDFAGQFCYGERVAIGDPVAISALQGTLPNGTRYVMTNDSGTEQSGDVAGDWRWENSSIMRIQFDRPVSFLAAPITSTNLSNPLVWSRTTNNATPRTRIISGNSTNVEGTFTYTAGAFDAQIDVTTNTERADSTLFNAGAPSALDDWGAVIGSPTTLIRVQGRDAEAMNFSVIETIDIKQGEAYVHKLEDGSIEHRDVITNEVVTDPVLVECYPRTSFSETTDDHELLGSLMCYEVADVSQSADYFDGGIQGEIDRVDGNQVFTVINGGSAEGDDQISVLDAAYACVTQGGQASLVIEADTSAVVTIENVTGANRTANGGIVTYEWIGANAVTGAGSTESRTIESIQYSCSIAPSPTIGKAYSKSIGGGDPLWYDHITHVELTTDQVASISACPVDATVLNQPLNDVFASAVREICMQDPGSNTVLHGYFVNYSDGTNRREDAVGVEVPDTWLTLTSCPCPDGVLEFIDVYEELDPCAVSVLETSLEGTFGDGHTLRVLVGGFVLDGALATPIIDTNANTLGIEVDVTHTGNDANGDATTVQETLFGTIVRRLPFPDSTTQDPSDFGAGYAPQWEQVGDCSVLMHVKLSGEYYADTVVDQVRFSNGWLTGNDMDGNPISASSEIIN